MREARVIDWNKVAKQAKKMTFDQLIFARNDCIKCSNLGMPNDGYYADCASVYYTELKKRGYVETYEII